MSEPQPIEVVVDGPPTPAWQARALANLASAPLLAVVATEMKGPLQRGFVHRAQAALERKFFQLGPGALAGAAPEPSAPPMGAAKDATGSPAAGTTGWSRSDPLRRAAAEATLTVWLSHRPVPPQTGGDLLYLRHAQMDQSPERVFQRALIDGATHIETELLLRRKTDTIVVNRTVSAVRPFSAQWSCDLALWKLAALVPRATERLPGLDLPATGPAPAGPPPKTTALLAHSTSSWTRVLSTRLLFRRPWSVQVRQAGTMPTRGWSQGPQLVSWRPGHVYADPFIFEQDNRHHLFCEEIPRGARRGVISHTELRLDGRPAKPPEPVLQLRCHLSYPFVFAYENDVFMIPETSAMRRIELYRATRFPRDWELDTVLLDGLHAADATILFHEQRSWLFAAVAAPGASSLDELHLFWADSPRGPWHAHPRNPVVSDVRGARPAGAIQRWGSKLVRVGQDGSRRYGGAISFREIDVLSDTAYAEHEIARLEASDVGARATHTYSADGSFEAIDLRSRVLRLPQIRGER